MTGPAQPDGDALRKAIYLLRARALGRSLAYSCFLDEQPCDLVPGPARGDPARPADHAELIVNPGFRYRPEGDSPEEVRARSLPLESFLRGCAMAWVEDPALGVWTPFWARGAWADALQTLSLQRSAPSDLSPAMRGVFALANILVAHDYASARRAYWQEICARAQSQFRADGYVVLRNLIHPFQLGAMRRYYRTLVAAGGLSLGDSQVSARYGLHSEILASFLHPQLANLIGRIAGEPVKPSYLYFASYLPGAVLPKHVDREQCEFSISLLLDYVPEADGPCGWPLFLEAPGPQGWARSADLGIGECVLYRGRELLHYRKALPAGHRSTSVFLHYVREGFDGRLW